ncbi:MAG: hypothetical protein NE327_10745 [Lentisphaeraceae bacterium]|nr:hypothetical protein [Lentisphaeraceae bacterium]
MIFKVLSDGRIWIQFILVDGTVEEKERYSSILPKYGTFSYTEEDIIEFISNPPTTIPSAVKARRFVEDLNNELNISVLLEA